MLLVICSAGLLLLLLVVWRFAVEHDRVAAAFLIGGPALLVAAFARGLRATGRARWYVTVGSLLVFLLWTVVFVLLLKATID